MLESTAVCAQPEDSGRLQFQDFLGCRHVTWDVFWMNSWECDGASHPAQLLCTRLFRVFAGGKDCADLGCNFCPQRAP